MKVIGVLASCRKGSSSAAVVKEVLNGAKDKGHEILIIELDDNLKGCLGCQSCKREGYDGFCVRDDVLKRLKSQVSGLKSQIDKLIQTKK